jgi:GNAT superfamily N-acetyltransferase
VSRAVAGSKSVSTVFVVTPTRRTPPIGLTYAHDVPGKEQNLVVRRALPGEAASLGALAMRSKAHWGYGQEFLEIVRPILTFTEADLVSSPVYVLEVGGELAGMYRLGGDPPEGELDDLWLEPRFIGLGAGRRLYEHALQVAAELGFDSLRIESDPNAEGFYLAMGATRIGERPSQSGRTLPLLRVTTRRPARFGPYRSESAP